MLWFLQQSSHNYKEVTTSRHLETQPLVKHNL